MQCKDEGLVWRSLSDTVALCQLSGSSSGAIAEGRATYLPCRPACGAIACAPWEAAFLKRLKNPEFAEAEEDANDLEPDPRATLHHRIVEGLSMASASKKTQADPCAKGLAGEPVAISESVIFWDHRR
jgi:hypothetical protein